MPYTSIGYVNRSHLILLGIDRALEDSLILEGAGPLARLVEGACEAALELVGLNRLGEVLAFEIVNDDVVVLELRRAKEALETAGGVLSGYHT